METHPLIEKFRQMHGAEERNPWHYVSFTRDGVTWHIGHYGDADQFKDGWFIYGYEGINRVLTADHIPEEEVEQRWVSYLLMGPARWRGRREQEEEVPNS